MFFLRIICILLVSDLFDLVSQGEAIIYASMSYCVHIHGILSTVVQQSNL